MPGKSRRKHAARSKKRKGGGVSLAVAAQRQAVAQPYKPQPEVAAPSVRVPTPMATPTVARYPYIVGELQRIGILAGIMLAILIVLALVLS